MSSTEIAVIDPVQRNLFEVDSPLHGKVRGEKSIMDFPFFSLSKTPAMERFEYKVDDISISIRPSDTGMATMYDKEIILYVASLMAQQIATDCYVDPVFTFTAHDFFRATGVYRPSSRDYKRFQEALERLQGTQIKTNIKTGSEIDRGWFSWLSEAHVKARQLPDGTEILGVIRVRLCSFLTRAIQRDKQIYSYHHNYFQLGTIERRLYELARCHCEGSPIEMKMETLAIKVGSMMRSRGFKKSVKDIAIADQLPEYEIEVRDVAPEEDRFDTRGRRVRTPDTVVTLKPRARALPSRQAAVAAA